MGARHELNKFHILGGIGVAGVFGLATGSWAVFTVTGVVLIGTSLCSGEIRFRNHGKRRGRGGYDR